MPIRKYLIIAAIVLIIGIAIGASFLALRRSPAPAPQNPGASFTSGSGPANIPVMVSGTIPASSYGRAAVGSPNATSVTLTAPVSSATLGTLIGMAKPAAGKPSPDFTTLTIGLFDPKTNRELAKMALGSDGSYKFIVEPGEYVLKLISKTVTSAQLPQRIYVASGEVSNLNFFLK